MSLFHNSCTITASAVGACGNLDVAVHGTVDTGAANGAVISLTAIGITTSTDIHNSFTITASAVGACGILDVAVHGSVDTGAANGAVIFVTAIGITTSTTILLIHNSRTITASAVGASGRLDVALHGTVDTDAANGAIIYITAIGITTSTDMLLIHNSYTITASAVGACGSLDVAVHGSVDTGADSLAVSSETDVGVVTCMHM